jgi:hypothetical protein
LIGGMSWVSTAMYYEQINKGIARKRGGLASAPLLIESVDFAAVVERQSAGEWDELATILSIAPSGSPMRERRHHPVQQYGAPDVRPIATRPACR